jgi:exosortase D (VPLPA-CTERM-specific)
MVQVNKRVTVLTEFPAPTGKGAGRRSLGGAAGPIVLALALAGAVAVFWMGIVSLGQAWVLPEYSHGPLIPVLSGYLFLRQLKMVPPAPDAQRTRWPGVLVMAGALVVAMGGNLAKIPDIVTYAMIVWIYGLVLVTFGWERGRQFWPPVLHLVFMLPLPAILYWQLSIKLQFISSELGVALIRAMDIPVFLDGNVIDLGIYKLQVAEACSGLRYLFPVMSFSYIFSVLYRGPIWHKAVLLLSAAPITVLMNSFRIGMIGVLVDNYGIEQAEGFLHYFEGWVIFIACVLILFGLARLMQWIGRDRRPLGEALDLDVNGLGTQAARAFQIRASAALIGVALGTSALGAAWHLAPARAAVDVPRDPLVLFPRTLDSWTGGPQRRLEPNIEAVLKADDYLSIGYESREHARPVDLFIAYYEKQNEGAGIHSPEVCIPGGGWEMSQIAETTVPVTLADGTDGGTSGGTSGGTVRAMPVNRAVIQKGLERQLVYYWFEQRGRRLTSDYMAKATTILDSITRGRSDGALVRLITPIGPEAGAEAAADARLRDFLGEMAAELARFVPE